MEAKIQGLSYPTRKSWVDAEYMLPTKEKLYAKSGKLLKSVTIKEFKKINSKWVPTHLVFKDELKRNSKGTEWIVEDIELNIHIPENRFRRKQFVIGINIFFGKNDYWYGHHHQLGSYRT